MNVDNTQNYYLYISILKKIADPKKQKKISFEDLKEAKEKEEKEAKFSDDFKFTEAEESIVKSLIEDKSKFDEIASKNIDGTGPFWKYTEALSSEDLKMHFNPSQELIPGFIKSPSIDSDKLSQRFINAINSGMFSSSLVKPTQTGGWDNPSQIADREKVRAYFLKEYSVETVNALEKQFSFSGKQVQDLIKYCVDLKVINPRQIALLLAAQGDTSQKGIDCGRFTYALTSLEKTEYVQDEHPLYDELTFKLITPEGEKLKKNYLEKYKSIIRNTEDMYSDHYLHVIYNYELLGYSPAINDRLSLPEILKFAKVGDVVSLNSLETDRNQQNINALKKEYKGKAQSITTPSYHLFKIIGKLPNGEFSVAQIDGMNELVPMRIITISEMQQMYGLKSASGVLLRSSQKQSLSKAYYA